MRVCRPAVRLVFAIPDHPWVVGVGRADVRIAMSVAERGEADGQGRWLGVTDEADLDTSAAAWHALSKQWAVPGCTLDAVRAALLAWRDAKGLFTASPLASNIAKMNYVHTMQPFCT